jgi:hypothetical protein
MTFISGNPNKLKFDPTTGTNILYVHSSLGDDTNNGLSPATALKTVQEAVNRFKLSGGEIPYWPVEDHRIIHVLANSFDENIVIPPHTGQGALIIEGEVDLLSTGTFTSFDGKASYDTLHLMNLSSGTFDNTVNNDSFVRLTNPGSNIFDNIYESFPVLTVSGIADTADVVAFDPGNYTAFQYSNGVAIEHVTPLVTWAGPTPGAGSAYDTIIRNIGGSPLIIRDFIFQPTASYYQQILSNDTPGSTDYDFDTVAIERCIIKQSPGLHEFGWLFRGHVVLSSCIIEMTTGAKGSGTIMNTHYQMYDNDSVFSKFSGNFGLLGLNVVGATAQTTLILSDGTSVISGADFRSKSNLAYDQAAFSTIYKFSCEGSTSPAIQIGAAYNYGGRGGNIVRIQEGKGTTGNTSYGVMVYPFNMLQMQHPSLYPSLSGTLGDLKIGGLAVRNWEDGSVTDASMARYQIRNDTQSDQLTISNSNEESYTYISTQAGVGGPYVQNWADALDGTSGTTWTSPLGNDVVWQIGDGFTATAVMMKGTGVDTWKFYNSGNLEMQQNADFVPLTDNQGDIGTASKRFATGHFGEVFAEVFVSPKASTPVTVLATDSRTVFTNEGASAEIVFNLPTAVAGLEYTFIVQDADGIQINASTGDTIRIANSVSATAGLIESATIGNSVRIVAINATQWIATSVVGTWTVT